MELVQKTLQGIAAKDEDEGRMGFGRNAASIRMGTNLWQTPALSSDEGRYVQERTFDDGCFPDTAELLEIMYCRSEKLL